MMRKGRRSKPPGVGICRVLMVVRRAGCVSFSPVSRLAQIGTVWSALETQPLWATSIADAWLLLGLRAGAGAGARRRSRECLLEGEAGAGVHHRRAPRVDGRDDLLGVDPLQVGAGRRQMRVPQLAM